MSSLVANCVQKPIVSSTRSSTCHGSPKASTVVACIRATGGVAKALVLSGSRKRQTTSRVLAAAHGLGAGYQEVELQVHRRKQVGTLPRPGRPIIASQRLGSEPIINVNNV